MTEIWKPVPNYNGIYEVSNLGNVRRIVDFYKSRKAPYVLKHLNHNKGYKTVALHTGSVNGVRNQKFYLVHRLVMSAFYGESNLHVNHIDGNKSNNSIENLEYCTIQENNHHAKVNNLVAHGCKIKGAKLNESNIKEIRHLKDSGLSVKSIASKFNVHEQNIYAILQGKSWTRV